MKQVLISQGKAVIENVSSPQPEPEKILVAVDHSCISIGTEMNGVRSTSLPLWKRALNQPKNIKKGLDLIKSHGISSGYSQIQNKVKTSFPTGYSAAGTVIAVGDKVEGFTVGDRVACAGSQFAHHAEIISVPQNLSALMPENLSFAEASTVTLGAIALQGVRRASPTLGESFVVIGLGLLGQLTVQLLKANGCRVIVSDLDQSRIDLALAHGADDVILPSEERSHESVARLTDGLGADGVIITAASKSDAIISLAFQMTRKKGRVVLVGDVGLNINREDIYSKEIDFFISCSYGPGRYDLQYEEKGLDYPSAYVRWTENRNMIEYLRLLGEGKIKVKELSGRTYSIDDAPLAYEDLKNPANSPLIALLKYDPNLETKTSNRVFNKIETISRVKSNKIKIALIGAGGFAKGMHLPNIKKLSHLFELEAIISKTGHNAVSIAKEYGAKYSSTDYQEAIEDPNLDAVIIATRHNLHGPMLLAALQKGKHVFVEKPLAISKEELTLIKEFYLNSHNKTKPLLMTGFNRRFSQYFLEIAKHTTKRTGPLVINYRMNAGYIPLDHWTHGPEGAGRNIGEACHIYDLFTFLTQSEQTNILAASTKPKTAFYSSKDNFQTIITFKDGSIATLTYSASGAKNYPKEMMEISFDGKTIILNDFKSIDALGLKINKLQTPTSDKGQFEAIKAFGDAIVSGNQWPIPLWEQIQATEISFEVEKMI